MPYRTPATPPEPSPPSHRLETFAWVMLIIATFALWASAVLVRPPGCGATTIVVPWSKETGNDQQ